MKKTGILIFTFIVFISQNASAFSVDSIYRDVIRSENGEKLPVFIKNQNSSSLSFDSEVEKYVEDNEKAAESDYMSFINQKKLKDDQEIKDNQDWNKTLKAIEENRITAIDLKRIQDKVSENDPKAIEIYAWMLTKGVGISKDYIKAFNLYKKADSLGVENAKQNSFEIYKVMTPDERSRINE